MRMRGVSRLVGLVFLAYSAALSVLVWCVLVPRLVVRIARRRTVASELRERLGSKRVYRSDRRPYFVIHAVSAGEMAAAGALFDALAEEWSDYSALLTTGNRDGWIIAERLQQARTHVDGPVFLPWDRAGAMRRWLSSIRPDAVIVVETEIWPNTFRVCAELNIPLFAVSARVAKTDVRRYALARPFFRAVLDSATWIGAQDMQAAARFVEIGAPPARVEAAGNLKFDGVISTRQPPTWWPGCSDAPLVIAGSTHHPEELWLLESLRQLRDRFPSVRLVLAPRHVSRSTSLCRIAQRAGFQVARWTNPPLAGEVWDVLIVDEVGWLASLYRNADVAVVGGTFANRGGQSPLEAAASGCVTIVGPDVDHIDSLIPVLETVGAVCRLRSLGTDAPGRLADALGSLLADPVSLKTRGQRAAEMCQAESGSARRYARAIRARIEGR